MGSIKALPLADWVNAGVDWLSQFTGFFNSITAFFQAIIDAIQWVFDLLPEWLFIIVILAFTYWIKRDQKKLG
ncbi:glycine/betaine ABC transporter permease, partial [Ligilactobacillus pabuli]|uniref:glycine/betaine ABC transporter permease n=1 Tax=Ligilactobacillus pabuli TaxID=2886039 RepID=UPI001FB96555